MTPRVRRVARALATLLLVGHLTVGQVAAAFAILTGNRSNVVSTDVLVAPTGLTAEASGRDVNLNWTPAMGATNHQIRMVSAGYYDVCPGSWSTIGTASGSSYVDVNRFSPQGTYVCYLVRTALGNWTSLTSNPVVSTRIGVVATSVSIVNAGNTSGCSGTGAQQFGQVGRLDCGDQIVVQFNQPMNPSTGPDNTRSVCAWDHLLLGSEVTSGSCGPMLVQSGSYVGNGVNDRAITGLGFQPDFVMIKSAAGDHAVLRSSTMTGDATKQATGAVAFRTNLIKSLDLDGFTVGTDDDVNRNGRTYYWVAMKAAAGEMAVGTYNGNGTDNRNITGVGFAPNILFVFAAQNEEAVYRQSTVSGDVTWRLRDGAPEDNRIQALLSDGFQVGTDDRVNRSGHTYHYVAIRAVAGRVAVGTYTGNGADNRNITGVGFQPEWVLIRDGNNDFPTWKPMSTGASTDLSLRFHSDNPVSNRIQALLSDGFQLGSDNDINGSGRTYHWIAFKRYDYPVAIPSLAMRSGSYTGNGISGRQITGVGFQPDVVLIKSEGANTSVIRTSTMNNNASKELVGTNALVNNRIIEMLADGFTLGTNDQVNGSGGTYHWVALRGLPRFMTVGTYTGNGVAGRTVSGLGFAPDLVIVLPAGSEHAVYRTSTMGGSNSANFETGTSTSWITGFSSDGFTVGSGSSVNTNGQTYHYIAVRQTTDQFVVGTYTGDGSVTRDVTGVGLQPEWVVVRQMGTQHPAHRPASMGVSSTSLRFNNALPQALRIRGLLSDGFQVGNSAEVNSNGVTYHYFAFANRTAPTTIDFAESVWLGALTGGLIGDCMCRFAATYTWSVGNRVLTVTIGERTHGTTYPTLSAATWTFWPTTVTARMQSATGGHHICDSSSGGGNCLPVTVANSRP